MALQMGNWVDFTPYVSGVMGPNFQLVFGPTLWYVVDGGLIYGGDPSFMKIFYHATMGCTRVFSRNGPLILFDFDVEALPSLKKCPGKIELQFRPGKIWQTMQWYQ